MMKCRDLYELNKKYDGLSSQTKNFFHPGFLGFNKISPTWILFQLGLLLSSNETSKKTLMTTFPVWFFIPVLAKTNKNEIVGLAYIKVKKKMQDYNFIGELGIFVEDNYRGLGIGKDLMKTVLSLAVKFHFCRIDIIVSANNDTAFGLYRKFGFKKKGYLRNFDKCNELISDNISMVLYLK